VARARQAASRPIARPTEAALLILVSALAGLGFALATSAAQLELGLSPLPALPAALLPPAVLALSLWAVHALLSRRGQTGEQLVLPIVGFLSAIGLVVIWRLQPADIVWQQLLRGWLPGILVMAVLVARPGLVERIRRDSPITISLTGLALLVATAFFGQVDATGARLSLRLGPLPPVQTSELIKLALIVFLAWYIDSQGARAEGRAQPMAWLRWPPMRYLVPGAVYVFVAVLALVRMSDLGAILVLGCLFAGLIYAGFEPRVSLAILGVGLALALTAGVLLAVFWRVPGVLVLRWVAFLNPWSQTPLSVNGQALGVTVAQGPGYQLQQAIYAVITGGLSGTGLGFGLPGNVPLAQSDFIFAAVVEELGALVGLSVLVFFAILFLRILRLSVMLPAKQVFERLLLIGIGLHLFIQVFFMVGGTLNLLPVTGLTIPFLSQGGIALFVNLSEIGLVLALAQRTEAPAG
jgi:cell division protein FtsW (lipid II flippase)